MNLKLRFALLFTSFVALILLISCATIFLLYATYREEDYFNRVEAEGNEVYRIFTDLQINDRPVTADFVKKVHDKSFVEERLFILDSAGKLKLHLSGSLQVRVPIIEQKKLQQKSPYRYADSEHHQHVILYKPETKLYVYVSGFDRVGLRKLGTLKVILTGVFFGGLFLTAIASFLFVNEAIKPIVQLSNQMNRTNELNLSERIEVRPARDEINAIAKNFNAMLERLKRAFEFQSSFVHHASHELRTPLAVMLSQTESALNKEHDAAGYKEVLRSLKEDQQQLIELTNSLLLISQYDKLEYLPEWPYVRIDELMYETIAIAKKIFPDIVVDISFEVIPVDDEQLLVKGSDSLLRSAFLNLIKNAYHYSIDQSVKIHFIPERNNILVQIDNRGPQLTSLEIDKIMIPFFRGENSFKKKGFGLGLSIINRIITIHHGTVNYMPHKSDLNRFTVALPIKTSA